jgi:cytochrome c556
MRFRTIALALALTLGSGAVSAVYASDKGSKADKQAMKRAKKLNKQRAKQSKGAKVKPRKAPKSKRA